MVVPGVRLFFFLALAGNWLADGLQTLRRPFKVPFSRCSCTSKRKCVRQLSASLEIVPQSYDLAFAFVAVSTAFIPGDAGSLAVGENPKIAKVAAVVAGLPLFLFGSFLAYQTNTLRFTFDDTAFSLVKSDLSSTGENLVVGGENRWSYTSFVNYDIFPNEDYPVLVYFKETQTAKDLWNVGPGQQANSPEALAKGAVEGQVHFFPAIGNVRAILDGFKSHGCAKL